MPAARRTLAVAALAALLVAGCGDKKPERSAEDIVPRVKTLVVQRGAEVRKRSLVGELQPTQTFPLSFPLAGRVLQVAVSEGDRVRKGQVLATMESLAYEVRVRNAEAEHAANSGDRDEKRDALQTRRSLRDQGFMAASMVDRYRVDLTLAEQKVSNSESTIALARRDLANTRLLAPADGVISARQVEPFSDVTAGQAVLRLDSGGGMRVAIRVPDRLIDDLPLGTATKVGVGARSFDGKVVRIDPRAAAGDAFPVYIALQGDTSDLRAGVTARVDFDAAPAGTPVPAAATSIQVPMASVVPGNAPGEGFMFVLQPKATRVKRVPVRIKAVNDGTLEIAQGLAPGDEIVAAGVAFLSDNQPVRRMLVPGVAR